MVASGMWRLPLGTIYTQHSGWRWDVGLFACVHHTCKLAMAKLQEGKSKRDSWCVSLARYAHDTRQLGALICTSIQHGQQCTSGRKSANNRSIQGAGIRLPASVRYEPFRYLRTYPPSLSSSACTITTLAIALQRCPTLLTCAVVCMWMQPRK